MAQSIAQMIREQSKARPDGIAITYEGRDITFAHLHRRSSRVAQGLRAEGVNAGDRVAYLDKNGPEYFETLFGGAKAGAVNVAVNWRLAPPEMAYIISDAQAKVLFVGREFLPHLDDFEAKVDCVQRIVVMGGGHDRHVSYEDWLAGQSDDDPGADTGPEDVCLQLYTSGTTGLPKGAMLSNRNLFSLLPVASAAWGFTADSVNLVCMPVFHIAGSGWGLVGMSNGGRTILMRDINPPEILELIPRYRITHSLFVPAVLQFLLATPSVDETDVTSLEMVVYGASPISKEVLARSIATFGCAFCQAYGLTETTGAVVLLMPEDHDPEGRPELLRAAGRAMDGVELRIVDPETLDDKPVGEVGEVWIRSTQVMKGYWNQPSETEKSVLPDGWFRSGDAGYLDDDGYLFIHDRVKDMIVSGAENVYPAEVENALMSHPAIADVAVIGVPDERWGETVKAVVVKAPGADVTDKEIIAFARERLAHFKCPTSVDWAESLPRSPSGKLLKKDIRAPYWEGRERFVH